MTAIEVPRQSGPLAALSQARAYLAEATSLADVVTIRDQAESIRAYLQVQRDSLAMQNEAAELKLRAERKAGELLAEMPKHEGGRGKTGDTMSQVYGIEKHQSSRWQRIASLPEPAFEEYIASRKGESELTTAGVLKLAKQFATTKGHDGAAPRPPVDNLEVVPEVFSKSKAAPAVWSALGDPEHYVEPFAGSMAVLLNRPSHQVNRPYHSETVNDIDGLLVNAWRAIQLHPHETADAASNPVAEADLHARHVALVRWREEHQLEHLMGDPRWCDPVMAGWWLWGQSSWIGGGWCSGRGPWIADETGRLVKQARGPQREPGVARQLPHLGNDGKGVNHANLREPGVDEGGGEWHPVTMPELLNWFGWLSARLRHVRILNGDWRRAVTSGASKTIPVRMGKGHAGIFLDPPYADTAGRSDDIYAVESLTVAHDVRAWCLDHGNDPDLRIVLAGFDGEHGTDLVDAGWTEVEWFAAGFLTGGMGNTGTTGHQQGRERLWLSPHCLRPEVDGQGTLWGAT